MNIIPVKTSSGFEWNIDADKVKSFTFVKSLANMKDDVTQIFVSVNKLLGDDGEKAIIEYHNDNLELIIKSFREILQMVTDKNKEIKNL